MWRSSLIFEHVILSNYLFLHPFVSQVLGTDFSGFLVASIVFSAGIKIKTAMGVTIIKLGIFLTLPARKMIRNNITKIHTRHVLLTKVDCMKNNCLLNNWDFFCDTTQIVPHVEMRVLLLFAFPSGVTMSKWGMFLIFFICKTISNNLTKTHTHNIMNCRHKSISPSAMCIVKSIAC